MRVDRASHTCSSVPCFSLCFCRMRSFLSAVTVNTKACKQSLSASTVENSLSCWSSLSCRAREQGHKGWKKASTTAAHPLKGIRTCSKLLKRSQHGSISLGHFASLLCCDAVSIQGFLQDIATIKEPLEGIIERVERMLLGPIPNEPYQLYHMHTIHEHSAWHQPNMNKS